MNYAHITLSYSYTLTINTICCVLLLFAEIVFLLTGALHTCLCHAPKPKHLEMWFHILNISLTQNLWNQVGVLWRLQELSEISVSSAVATKANWLEIELLQTFEHKIIFV